MANAPNNTRIQHFSNPDILFGGESTGQLNVRDNASQIRGAFCEVADNNVPRFFATTFEQEEVVCPNEQFWAFELPQDGLQNSSGFTLPWEEIMCTGPYSYQWTWSINPFFFGAQNIGTNSPYLLLPNPPNCPQFYLRLTVTSAQGCTATFTKMIKCASTGCNRSQLAKEDEISTNRIFPNPASDRLNVKPQGLGKIERLVLVGASGTSRSLTQWVESDTGTLSIDISGLQAGIWFLQIQGAENQFIGKFIIAK